MKFRTELPAPRYPFHIEPDSRLMFCGSCFSEHVSSYFADRGFAVCANPFGILFNPLSIAQGLDFLTG
ncbi:MAG: GSCFA domain-containing protein, partial [Bacteroidales bacterium]|nr:GSCFA domain-containing protein [Bacteroidales bacterium]